VIDVQAVHGHTSDWLSATLFALFARVPHPTQEGLRAKKTFESAFSSNWLLVSVQRKPEAVR
jgi:hypothetical protein